MHRFQSALLYSETMRPSLGSGDLNGNHTRTRKYRYHRNKVIIDFDTLANASYDRRHFLARRARQVGFHDFHVRIINVAQTVMKISVCFNEYGKNLVRECRSRGID